MLTLRPAVAVVAMLLVVTVARHEARAEDEEPVKMRPVLFEAGAEMLAGSESMGAQLKVFAALVVKRGAPILVPRKSEGNMTPRAQYRSRFLALGAQVARAWVFAGQDIVTLRRVSIGPQVRGGWGWMYNGLNLYTWIGGGPTWNWGHERSGALPEEGRHLGSRVSIGFAAPKVSQVRTAAQDAQHSPRSPDDGQCMSCDLGSIFAPILPSSFELSWEHVAGVDRIGLGMAYAF